MCAGVLSTASREGQSVDGCSRGASKAFTPWSNTCHACDEHGARVGWLRTVIAWHVRLR